MKRHATYLKLFCAAALITSISSIDVFAATDKICALTLELQEQQAKMEYASRLATAIGSQPTNVEAMYQNTEPATFSTDGSFTLFSYGGSDTTISSTSSLQSVDQFSAECLSCHDGVSASLVQPKIQEYPSLTKTYSGGHSARDHSIGMRYELYPGTGSYKPVIDGSSNMLFIDGKVGCLTCHNPLNPEKNHLVKSDVRSALCMTCHIR